jgi:tetratricopeptide (TPR) repeat protein
MNEDRMTAYANLIKEIKDSPIGQEWVILNQYPDLMDETLITVMKQATVVLANRGELEQADRFVKLVIQLKDKLSESDPIAQLKKQQNTWIKLNKRLNNLAALYHSQGRYPEVEPLYKQALEMGKRLFNGDHPSVANSLNNLAAIYESQGRYPEAEPLYKQALEMSQRLFNGDHTDVASSLNDLAALYESQGRYAEAEPLFKQSLEMFQRLFNGDHDDVATSLHNLAELYRKQGCYSEAEPLHIQALKMRKRLFNGDHHHMAFSLNNLAELYRNQGRYSEAEPLYLQALKMRKNLFNGDHPDIAISLNTLGVLYWSQKRYSEAEHLLKQALEMGKRLFNGDHPSVAIDITNLAELYNYQGHYGEAETFCKQALLMFQRLFKGDHPNVALNINNLASLYRIQGRYSEAETLYKKSLDMFQRLFNGVHPNVATSLSYLASLYRIQGRYSEAEPLYKQALEMRKILFKGDHPDVADSLNKLGNLLAFTNRPDEAFDKKQQAIEMEDRLMRSNFAFSSEQERLQLIKNNRKKFDIFLSLASQYFSNSPEQVQKTLDIVLKRKSMTAEALAAFNFAIHSQRYSHLKPQFNRLRSLQKQLFHRTYNPPLPDPEKPIEIYRTRLGEYQKDIAQLEQQCQQLEKELATQVPEIQLEHQTVDRRAVALELPANAVLVEYVGFNRYDFTAPKGENWKSAEYWAFILPAENPDAVQMISLGEAQPIDDLIEKVRQVLSLENNPPPSEIMGARGRTKKNSEALEERLNAYQYNLQYPNALRERIFNPLLSILQPYENIFIAPDSQLSLIPFGLLPVDETGQQLLRDNYQISYLSSGKDVLRWKLETDRKASESLIIANPNFDYPQPPSTKPKTQALSQSGAKSHSTKPVFHSLSSKEFDPLPETETLAKSIAEKLAIPNLYLGDEALETLFSETACPRILLIATHGYFEPESPYIRLTQELLKFPSEDEAENLLAKNRDLVNPQLLMAMENQAVTFATQGKENIAQWLRNFAQKVSEQYKISPALNLTENPLDRFAVAPANNAMIRAGLAFAGANTSRQGQTLPPEAGKGLLLAQDVVGIDLWENEVTILIACQTGLGDVQLGEGVFGLRRAFAVAGCKALIMSLWSVPTRASLLLMDRFLSDVEQGLGKREALLKAQSYIRTITIRELQQFPLGFDILAEFIEKKVISEEFIETNPDYQLLSHPYFWGAWISQGEM